MFFNMKEMRYIWNTILSWNEISEAQFCPSWKPQKDSLEIYMFFINDSGSKMRLDHEISAPPVGKDWSNEMLDSMLTGIREIING